VHNLTLDQRRFVLQPLAQRLQFGDELIDLLHCVAGRPLQQRGDVGGLGRCSLPAGGEMPLDLDRQNRGSRLRLARTGSQQTHGDAPHRSASGRTLFGPIAESKCD
jgi:hypothetical protein